MSSRYWPFCLLFMLWGLACARAATHTIDDCEKIQEASAYNLCLASFGPHRGQHNLGSKYESPSKSAMGRGGIFHHFIADRPVNRRGRGVAEQFGVMKGASGRMSMQFMVLER